MADIVAFLAARLDEDEAAAKACGLGIRDTWHTIEWYDGQFEGQGNGRRTVSVDVHGIAGTPITSRGALLRSDGEHIARHDPARVRRQVASARRVMARHMTPSAPGDPYRVCHGCGHEYGDIDPRYDVDECPELRDLAAIYDDHPDYDPAWRPE